MDKLITSILFDNKDEFDIQQRLLSLLEEENPWKCFSIEVDLKKLLLSHPNLAKVLIRKPKTVLQKIRMSMVQFQNRNCLEEPSSNSQTKPVTFGLFGTRQSTKGSTKHHKIQRKLKQKRIKLNLQIVLKLPEAPGDELDTLLSPWKSDRPDGQSVKRDYREELSILRGRVVRVSQAKMWEKLSQYECSECKQTQIVVNELNALADSKASITCLADPEYSDFNWKLWSRNNPQKGPCMKSLRTKREGVLGKFVEVHLEIEQGNTDCQTSSIKTMESFLNGASCQ